MSVKSIENDTIFELIGITLFSIYAEICFSTWMPSLNHFPHWFHLFIQFLLIGMPQAAIIIAPHYILKFYLFFGIFGVLGIIFSSLRFRHVKRMMMQKDQEIINNFDPEKINTAFNPVSNENLLKVFESKPDYLKKRSNSISLYQTCIMMMTITAISAVDFKVFPSRFRKSRTFGISLMDIGVSLIITASGLVMTKYLHDTSKLKFKRLIKSSVPLFIFGIIKAVLSSKFKIGAEEYGKHWNFFINLALIPFTLLVANALPSIHFVPLICTSWMIFYQYLLTYRGYSEYILKPLNESFWEQNKKGIFSLGGYCCLFLMSCYIGKLYFNLSRSNRYKIIITLAILSLSMWGLFLMIVNMILPSRPLGNITYVLWGLANGTLHSLILAVYDSVFPERYRFIIFAEMISEYRLSTFLLANFISFLIRKVADIKSPSMTYALTIVFMYLFITCSIISIFFYRNHVIHYNMNNSTIK